MSIIPMSDKDDKNGFIGFFISDSKDVSEYQLETIKANSELGFVKIIDEKNLNGVRIFCEKDGKKSLKQILGTKKLDFHGFLNFTSKLLEINLKCEEYLLNRECIILEENFILFDQENENPLFFFLPLKQGRISISEDFKRFLQKILLKSEVDETKVEMDEYREFFEYLQKKDFTIKDFSSYFEELRLRRRIRKPRNANKEITRKIESNSNSSSNSNLDDDLKKKVVGSIKRFDLTKYIPMIIVIFWVIYLFVSLITAQKLGEIFGGSMVFALCIYFSYKKRKDIIMGKDTEFETENDKIDISKRIDNENINISQKINRNKYENECAKESDFNVMDTVRLEDYIVGRLRLINDENEGAEATENSEWVEIKERIYVGRNENLVDVYISNPSVGKVHCEIWKVGREFFLRDLNSANGTYINDERVIPEHNFILKSGDILKFSTQEAIIDIE